MTRGFVIGAPRSGGGKTTVSLGLMRAFARRGLKVAAAKCGPDYIDPAFHRAATGRDSVNLDSWAMAPDLLASLFARNAEGAEIVIAEALMGFFDGVPAAPGRTGSSADVAAASGLPLVLVLDVSGQAQTAAAVAKGFASYNARIPLAGVILNRVGSERHRFLCDEAMAAQGIPVLGAIPRMDDLVLPERHLGLVQAEETPQLDALLDAIADRVEAACDLERILAASSSLALSGALQRAPLCPPGQRIAVARDAAFSFLYPHIAQGWRAAGAELVFFSPLADEAPPADCDCCWLPGGYPELHAGRLASAQNFLGGIRNFAREKIVHGECGGYMVLGAGLVDAAGARHEMAGLLDVETSFAKRKLHLGYRAATILADHPLGAAGALLRGHEFHYASVLREGAGEPFASVQDAYGGASQPAGRRQGNVSGSFFHVIATD
jgi:cobyrinic acid a,c-diamide synthase